MGLVAEVYGAVSRGRNILSRVVGECERGSGVEHQQTERDGMSTHVDDG